MNEDIIATRGGGGGVLTDETRPVSCGVVSAHAFTRLGSADDEAALAAQFASARAIALRGFLAADLLSQLDGLLLGADFARQDVARIGRRSIEKPARAAAAIRFVLKRAALFQWLEQITGCSALGGASGDVVRMRHGEDESLSWHDDKDTLGRVLGVTINLGALSYDGGDFEMRRKGETALCCRHHHAAPGDALVFEVSRGLEHRVTPLTAGGPRTIFAGWFMAA